MIINHSLLNNVKNQEKSAYQNENKFACFIGSSCFNRPALEVNEYTFFLSETLIWYLF